GGKVYGAEVWRGVSPVHSGGAALDIGGVTTARGGVTTARGGVTSARADWRCSRSKQRASTSNDSDSYVQRCFPIPAGSSADEFRSFTERYPVFELVRHADSPTSEAGTRALKPLGAYSQRSN